MTLTITLPLPKMILSPNGRAHWRDKAKATKEARTRAQLETLSALPGGFKPRHGAATTRVEWHSKTKTRPDRDNALSCCKASFDGIADAGFISNDKELTHEPVQFYVDKLNPRLVIHITPTGPSQP